MSDAPESVEEQLRQLDAVIARERQAAVSDGGRGVSAALLQRGFVLQCAGRLEEAESAYRALADRFRDPSDDAIRRDVVRALQQRAYVLELARAAEAQASFDEAAAISAELARPTVERIRADVDRACELEQDGRYEEALELLGDVIRPWGHAPPPHAAEQVAFATVLSAQTAVRAGPNVDAALMICDLVVEHYGESSDPGVRAMVVWALTTKGYVHACAQRYDAAAEACAAALDYAGDNPNPRVTSAAADAREQLERWRAAGTTTGNA